MPDIFGFPDVAPAASTSGNFVRGLKQSGHQLAGTAYGIAGLAGAGMDVEPLKQWGLENAQRKFDDSDALSKPTDQLEGIDSIKSGVDWLTHGLGYVVGQAAPSILTGGAGAFVAKKVAQAGIQSLTKAELEHAISLGVVKEAAQAGAARAAGMQVAKSQATGAMVGAGLASYGQEAGSIYPDMVKEGHDEPGRAALFALPAAALDVIPEMGIIKKLFPFGNEAIKESGSMLRRGITGGLKQAGAEAVTEGAQTLVERAASYKSLNDKEAWSDVANSAALGALGGGALGGVTSALTPGKSILATSNPEIPPAGSQGELPIGPGGGGAPNITADTLDIGPQLQQPTTVDQPDLFAQTHQYDRGLQPTTKQFTSPTEVEQSITGQVPPAPQPIVPAVAPIVPSAQPIVSPTTDTLTTLKIAERKKSEGKLLTPYETFLVNNQQPIAPTPPVVQPVADHTVPRPSDVAEGARYTAAQFGYKLTEKRAKIATAAEDAMMSGTIEQGDYDQIHTLLAEGKLAKAANVLVQNIKPKEKSSVPNQSYQEAPNAEMQGTGYGRQERQEAPNANAEVQVGRQSQGTPGLLETPSVPVKTKPAPKLKAKPVVTEEIKPLAQQKPRVVKLMSEGKSSHEALASAVDPKEIYEDNHQAGEPEYSKLSNEDKVIWDDLVATGQGSTSTYDKFQSRIKRNAAAEKRASIKLDEDGDVSASPVTGTIRKVPDVLRKAPSKVLDKIKVKIDENSKGIPIKEALKAIDEEIAGYKVILKCVG